MPWTKRSTSSALAPALSSAAFTASITPSDWSLGVLGALAVIRRSPSSSAASVNVPPTSTPRSIAATYRSNRSRGRARNALGNRLGGAMRLRTAGSGLVVAAGGGAQAVTGGGVAATGATTLRLKGDPPRGLTQNKPQRRHPAG